MHQVALEVLGKSFTFLGLGFLTCKMGSIALPVSVETVRGQEIIHTTAAGAQHLALSRRSIKCSPAGGPGDGGARRDPRWHGTRLSAGSRPARPAPTHPRPPLSLRCSLKSQMGREERGPPRPAPSPHLDKHAPPAPPPAPDRRPGGRDGQAAGAARQRLTSKGQRPPAGGALIRPGCRRPAICSALERAPMGAGAAGIEWHCHRLSEL